MNPREIVELRLQNQHLSGAPLPTPADVVGWLGAMQAQEYPVAKWSIGLRREAHLLQGYDEFVIADSQSRHLLDLAGIISAGADERLRIHVVILDGQVVPRWRRVARAASVTIDAALERPLSAHELRAVHAAVERYASFIDMPARLQLSR